MSIEMAKKAYEMAYDAFKLCLQVRPSHEAVAAAVGPMAAEIYRQLTRLVVVTVKDKRFSDSSCEKLKDVLADAGYRGVITSGDIEYKFPTEDQVEVTIEGKVEEDDDN